MTLIQARAARDAARKLVEQGIHPSHHRQRTRLTQQFEHANTFEAVAREWMQAHVEHPSAPWSTNTYRQRKNLLESEFFPHIGALPMRQVTPAHAHAIVARIAKRAPQMAVIARQSFGSISRLAIRTGRADTELGYVLRDAVKTADTVHKTPLAAHEIPQFFRALEKYPGTPMLKGGIRLQWLTLTRPIEVIKARVEQFHLENGVWSIPSATMKKRQPHRVPLPRQAIEIVRALLPFVGTSGPLIPNRKDPSRSASAGVFAKAFSSMGYDGKFSPHGVRVTGRTILGEQGHPRDVLERQLAHVDKKHVRAYDQGDRLEARRKIMQGYADYLDALCAGANVIPIKSRRA